MTEIQNLFTRLSDALAEATLLRKALEEITTQQVTTASETVSEALGRAEVLQTERDSIQEEFERERLKIEAYDAANEEVKRDGLSRAEYVLRTEIAETEAARIRKILKTDDDVFAEIETFLFQYDSADTYESVQERIKAKDELRARLLLRVGAITEKRYLEACEENEWSTDSKTQIEALLTAATEKEKEDAI